ncbi:MAG: hypothetical protein ACLQIH_17255 [Myxococcaceae bacterium]
MFAMGFVYMTPTNAQSVYRMTLMTLRILRQKKVVAMLSHEQLDALFERLMETQAELWPLLNERKALHFAARHEKKPRK